MLNSIIVLLTSVMLLGCVVSPDGWNNNPGWNTGVDVGVDSSVDVDFTPRVHVGSRSGLSVWLHPNFVTADAYLIAQQHCESFGAYARPARDWDIHVSRVRYLDYTCVSYRPRLGFPHIIVDNNRWFNRPWHRRWYNRRYGRAYVPGSTYTPKPRRNGWWNRGNRGRNVSRPVTRPSKGRYRGAPVRNNRRNTYTPKPKPSPKRNGWWGKGSNVNRPSKSSYTKDYNRADRPTKKPSGLKWSFKKESNKKSYKSNSPKKEKYSFKKKVIKKSKYSTKPDKVEETKTKKTVKKIKKPKKVFSKTKINRFKGDKVSKKRFKTL